MAITVERQVWGTRAHYEPAGGKFVERYAVKGLDPTLADNYVRAINAVDSVTGVRIPPYQNPHPTIVGISVMGFDTLPMGTEESPARDGIWVDVTYGTPDFIPNTTLIEISGITGTQTINYWPYGDQQGKQILVGASFLNSNGQLDTSVRFDDQINPDDVKNFKSDSRGTFKFDYAEIPVISGGMAIKFTRREPTPPNIATIRRKTNSAPWQGLGSGLWIMWNVTARNIVGVGSLFPGGGWEICYTALSATDLDSPLAGFTQVAFFKDEHTGKQIPQANPLDTTNNGYTRIVPYGSFDFGSLNLPNVY